MQVPQSSANASVHVDAGLRPVWAVVAERVISYARSVSSKSSSYWAKMAFTYNLSQGNKNAYSRYLGKNMASANTSLQPSEFIKKGVTNAAISSVLKMQRSTATTTFALRPMKKQEKWFSLKPWVSDSAVSKMFAEFRICNIGIGNRKPAGDGNIYKLCPLCRKAGKIALNNEVHLVIECPYMEQYRQACTVGPFIAGVRSMKPQISSLKLYSMFVSDDNGSEVKNKAISLYSMKLGWHLLMNIPISRL